MNKKTIAFVTTCGHGASDAVSVEKEIRAIFMPEKFNLIFHHGNATAEDIVESLRPHANDDHPFRVVLHASCNIPKIVGTQRSLRSAFNNPKIYYRKKTGGEDLQASMQKIACFSKLLQEEKLQEKQSEKVAA